MTANGGLDHYSPQKEKEREERGERRERGGEGELGLRAERTSAALARSVDAAPASPRNLWFFGDGQRLSLSLSLSLSVSLV